MIGYWRERFDLLRFGPAAALVGMAAAATGDSALTTWGVDTLLALTLIAQFRLWDDLADRQRDRRHHSDRILATAVRIWPFVTQAVGLAAVNAALVLQLEGPTPATGLLVLNLAAAAYYALRGSERTVGSDLMLLAKYPAFVLILSGSEPRPGRLVLAMATTYAAACAFEVWHDASGPMRVNQS